MKGVILASHGKLAEGMLDTLSMFNELQKVVAICLLPQEDIAMFYTRLQEKVSQVADGDGVVIFCDLLFGSPCNVAARFLKNSDDIQIVTGMNLAMVLEFMNNRDMEIASLLDTGKSGIVDFNTLYRARQG